MTVLVINITDAVVVGLAVLLALGFGGAVFLIARADRKRR